MPNKPHGTPAELTVSWPDRESDDPAGEAARRFVMNLRTAMGEKSIRSVAAGAGLEEASVRRVLAGAAWPHFRAIVMLEEFLGACLYTTLAESTIGLFKNEPIREKSPFRAGPLKTIDDVEWITAGWVDWYNSRRLHSTLGAVPPDEFETAYYAGHETPHQLMLAPA